MVDSGISNGAPSIILLTPKGFLLHILMLLFCGGWASQAGDADSSRAPVLNSGLQGPVNVHRGALLLVPQ